MKKGGLTLELPIGKNTVKVNGVDTIISQPALIKEGTTYVAVSFVSEQIGYEVGYKKENGKAYIDINSPAYIIPEKNSQEDKFVNDYVKKNGLEVIKYIMADMNKDSVSDYILLVRSNPDYQNEIILIDGKSIKIFGKPKGIEDIPNPTYHLEYKYDDFTIVYASSNYKYPWGSTTILLHADGSGKSNCLGTKPGMSPKEVKNILGRPLYEGISELSSTYDLVYEIEGYTVYFIADHSDGKVLSIIIKHME